MHGLVGGDGPERVEVYVDNQEPQDQGQCCQLGFETDGNQNDEGSPDQVLEDLRGKQQDEHVTKSSKVSCSNKIFINKVSSYKFHILMLHQILLRKY